MNEEKGRIKRSGRKKGEERSRRGQIYWEEETERGCSFECNDVIHSGRRKCVSVFFYFCFAVFPLVSLLELELFFRYSKNISKDDKKKKFQERYLTVLV